MKKVFFITCILLTSTSIFAKEIQPVTGILKTTASNIVTCGDSVEISVSKPAGTMDYKVKNIISLKLDQNTDTFLMAATSVRTKLSIYRWNANNVAISPNRTENLEVSINNRYNQQTIDLSSLKLENGYKVIVVIDSIFINGTSVSTLPKFVYVESEIFLTRYYDFSAYVNTEIDDISIVAYNSDCDTGNVADELELNWGTVAGAEEYQLEWTYVNNYGTTSSNYLSTSKLLADFKNNSTRITTVANTYRISLTYEKGYIAFRARAVGRDYLDPEVYMYSVWSEADTGRMNTVASNARYQILNAHENNKNWQYSSTFAEEGKKKEVISYFDGSLHNRQSVTKVNSDKNVIVGETIYDYQGRPAINVLPVPVTFPDCDSSTVEPAIKFYPRFNINLNDEAYSKSDFDLDDTTGACNTRVPGMDTLSGASQYYSGNNPDKSNQQAFLPDAKLYPFSQVEYTPDNTGRIRSQSGVGGEFQLGSGHETKYIYGQPNQIQLDRLFGSEAGDASHYKKNIIIDANGQASVTYLNQEGKTVATALAGNPPTDSVGVFMEGLASESNSVDTLLIDLFNKNSNGISLLNKVTTLQDGIEFSTQLPVAYASNYKFTYDLTVGSFVDSCMRDSICLSCIYDLEIRVTDECGINLISPTINKTVGHLDTIPNGFTMTCTDSSGYEVNDSVILYLEPGSYTVSKVLTVNQDAKKYYIEKYLDTTYNSCFRTLNDFIAEELASLDTTSCYTTCSACVEALGTRDEYVSSGRGTEVEYDFLYEECLEPCKDVTLCDASYEMMLIDVSPGGQYGKFDEVTVTATDKVSVFNKDNLLNPNQYTGRGSWKMPRLLLNGNDYRLYLDEKGIREKVNVAYNLDSASYYPQVDYISQVFTDPVTGQSYTYPENLKHLSDFMSMWKPSFARSLVMFHPEYAYYIACTDHKKIYSADTMSSNQFDSLLQVSQTFQMAFQNGFIQNNYDSIGIDPINKFTPVMFKVSGKLYDPFFTNSGYSLSFPKAYSSTVSHLQTTMQNAMASRYGQFVNIAGINYSMPEMAAYMARCGSNFTSIPTAECMAFGTDYYDYTVANYAAKNDSIRDKEWSLLKGFYLSEKRKLQFKRMDFYALHYNRASSASSYLGGCNACIPGPFNMVSAGMASPHSIYATPVSQWYNRKQPCSIYTYTLYSSKQKRFSAPDGFKGADGSSVGYTIYQQTGQCPMAFLLQNFLNEMAADSILNSVSHVNLSSIDSYSPDMYTAFNSGTTPTLFKEFYWDVISDTLDVLYAFIKDPTTGGTVGKMKLDISGTSISSIGEITGISGLAYDSVITGGYAFHAVASYLIGDTLLASDIITGGTSLNIKDCNFTPECTANQFAADFSNMMNSIHQSGELYSTGYYVSADTLLDPVVTPTIKNILGTPSSNLKWKFTSPNTYELYDSLNVGTKLRMSFITVTPSVSSSVIAGFTNIRSNYNNLFKMDVLDTTGVVVSEILGKMEFVSTTGITGISMGECALPASPECSTTEHQVRTDLEKLISEFIVKDSLNDINLFSHVSFTPLLQSYMPVTLLETGSVYSFDTTALNSHDTILFEMDNACVFELYHNVHDSNAVANNFNDIIAITDLTGTGSIDAAGNFYDFYFIGIYNNGGLNVSDTIRGTSCWPLKNCEDCDSTMISPSAMDSTVTGIPTVYNGWSTQSDPITIDTLVCDTAYQAFVAVLQNYNNSAYAIAHSDTMDLNIIPTFNMFLQSGYCNCNYSEYLQEYIDDTTMSLPPPVDINHYTECDHTADMSNGDYCKILHGQVLAAANAYNNFIKPLMDSLHYPSINVNLLPSGSVFSSKYCNCGEKFIAGLQSLINGYSPDSAIVYQMIQLDNSCETAPCVPSVKDTLDFVSPPMSYSPNPCVQQMLNIAVLNAQNTYGQYIDSMTTSIAKRYTEHCLDAIENFNYSYTDKEYHYTLYYYDQAGNLVKTVPPEGVDLLDIDSSTDPLEIKVKEDREQNTQRVFTNHRLATNYEYNSLNQLVYQDMPDHDKMQMIDFSLPNGLDSRLKIIRTQFVSSSKGYLSGYVGNRGYLYTTDNGGNNWKRVNNLVATDLNDIYFATSSVGYAVGNDGICLKTTNGGMTWNAQNLHSSYQGDFNSVWFTSSTAGVIGGAKTASSPALFYTTDGGATLNSSSDFSIGDTITGITHDGSNYFASVKNNGTGKIYKSSNASDWDEVTKIRTNNLEKVRYQNVTGGVMAYAVGEDGTLLKTPINSTTSWQLVQTGTSKAFKDIYFSTQLNGVAIIDSVSGKGQIWKTFDGGNNWELLSPPGLYYTSLQEYQRTKVLACGENGLISRVLMTSEPFGHVRLEKPALVNDLQYADAVLHSGNPQIVTVGNNDTLYYVENAGVSDLNWKNIKTSSFGVSSGDANYKKVLIKDSLNTLLKGMLLTQNGKLYSLYKNSGDTFSFNIALIKNLSGGSISSYFFNDLTMDSHTSPNFYAYDTVSKRAFRGCISSGTATFIYIDTVTSQQLNIKSLAVDSVAGNLVMGGSKGTLKHKSNPNSSTTNYSDRTFNTKPVPLNGISARYDNEIYAAGNDGSIWGTFEGNTWKLLNSGISDDINKIRIKTDYTIGVLACEDGKLYIQNAADTSSITLTSVDLGTEEDLTAVGVNNDLAYVGTSDGKLIRIADINNPAHTNVNIEQMSGSFHGLSFPTGLDNVYAVGDGASVYQAFDDNSVRVNEMYTFVLTGMSFSDANNGYIVSQKSDIRRTTDGGNTWKVIVPQTVPVTMCNIFATKTNQAVLIGSDKYLSVINSELTPTVVTVSGGASGVDLTAIDFNKSGYGVIAGEERNVYSLTASGNSYSVTHLGQTASAASEYKYMAAKVFPDNSFLIAGEQSKIFYYNGSMFTRQTNYASAIDDSTSTTLFDIHFLDDRTGYISGSNGVLLKSTLTSNIMDGAGAAFGNISWGTVDLQDPFDVYNGSTETEIDIYTIDFTDRHHGFLGGMFNTAITNAKYAMLLDDNSNYYSTRFFYDKLGRMVVSQNSKQYNKSPKAFSYTKYDALGRIKEVGEKSENTSSVTFRKIFGSDVGGMFNSNTINDDSLSTWLAGNGARKEVTKTYYDTIVFNSLPIIQENLRKRVASVTYEDVDDNVDSTYQHSTHYNYDIHGNVKTLVQDNPMVNVSSQRYKRIDYDYDLISGKVNKVIYQPDAPDMFIHRYNYDADNRITRVETSTDDIVYKLDAKYFYYAHGPLARTEYGENQVQGLDYAYTLQGWIKGVNSNTLSSSRDMGQDGLNDSLNPNANFAEDAFGYTLGYYEGDYKAISGVKWNTVSNRFEAQTAGAQFEGQRHNLYNGNISHMVSTIVETDTTLTGLVDVQTPKPLASAYKYDQLNRLKKSVSFNNISIPSNLWQASGQTVSNMYANTFSYDANGNILTQDRHDDAGVKFENMDYRYKKDANGDFMHNRLYHVNDSASSGLQGDDIDDQGAFNSNIASINTVNNYRFDEIGNLIADSTEQIDTISWNVYGKIKEIKRTVGSAKKNLKFDYDASGNRTAKHILSSSNNWEKSTYYIRDGQGNVMSTYDESVIDSSFSFKLTEQHLYGASRIGIYSAVTEMIGADTTNDMLFDTLNKRVYEIANHLNSVMTVVFDRKIAIDTNNDGTVDLRYPDIASISDYSSFGAKLPNRGSEAKAYRVGFNGKENDNEVKGNGNQQDYGFRVYDPRLGKFFSVDPLFKNYTWNSSYSFAENDPINFIDLDGLEKHKNAIWRNKPIISNNFQGGGLIAALGGLKGKYFKHSAIELANVKPKPNPGGFGGGKPPVPVAFDPIDPIKPIDSTPDKKDDEIPSTTTPEATLSGSSDNLVGTTIGTIEKKLYNETTDMINKEQEKYGQDEKQVKKIDITVGPEVFEKLTDKFKEKLQKTYPNAEIDYHEDKKGGAETKYKGTEIKGDGTKTNETKTEE